MTTAYSDTKYDAGKKNTIVVAAGTSASAAVQGAGLTLQGPSAVIVVKDPDGKLHDLSWIPTIDTEVEPISADSEAGRSVVRHSTAHVLAQAVQHHFPHTKLGIGPPIADGFYYDFLSDHTFTPADLEMLSKTMTKIIKDKQRFSRRVYSSQEEALRDLDNEPLKQELIKDKSSADDDTVMEIGGNELTAYDNLNPRTGERIWFDLCKGPHVPTTKHIPAFALLKTSAAYWRGNAKNVALQRIYGTAWESQEALDQYLTRLAQAEQRDHRKLGAELDLFSFPSEIGSGLPVFHPLGGIIRATLEEHSRHRHTAAGYSWVNTPHITKGELFELSGHLQWYKDGMYPPMRLDEECDAQGEIIKQGQDYYLKPMNCPMHNLIFRSRGRSYRELPLRLCEFGTVYRYEKSGVVHGLTRARGFTQDDAHIYCTEEQLESEITSLLEFVLSLLSDYGLTDYYLELSTKDPEKYIGSDEIWEKATSTLEAVARKTGLELVPDPGGAAFYGPKISVQAKDALGRTWQMSTIQIDFNLPERFDLEYTASDGTKKRPVMIHRALFGSVERFLGVLTEHYGGAFPAWLAPQQVIAIPVAHTVIEHLEKFIAILREHGIRAELDYSDDRMQKKIRTHTKNKVPFMILAGERDQEAEAVSFRFRDGSQINGIGLQQACSAIDAWINQRINDSPSAENFAQYCTITKDNCENNE